MNNTFHASNFQFNACVGHNGDPDIEAYAHGYGECVRILLSAAIKGETPLDTIVYPIVYSARHYIELTLKHQLSLLGFMNQIVTTSCKYNVAAIHDISTLWDDFKSLASFDSRYLDFINDADNYILDFSEIDNNGETFRYPYSNNNFKHLSELNCIDICDFGNRFKELFEMLEVVKLLTNHLIGEYKQKSIVGYVSRDKIEKIAKRLPPIETWGENSFDEFKAGIKIDFSLSSKQLSRIITFIKSHREFSSLINKEIIVGEIDSQDLEWFINQYDIFILNRSKSNYFNYLHKMINKIERKLSKEKIASIAQLYDMGYFNLYSEEYDAGLKFKMQVSKYELIRNYLLGNGIVKENIKRGLQSMGQKTLLRVFE
jgi:hypothetical protein